MTSRCIDDDWSISLLTPNLFRKDVEISEVGMDWDNHRRSCSDSRLRIAVVELIRIKCGNNDYRFYVRCLYSFHMMGLMVVVIVTLFSSSKLL